VKQSLYSSCVGHLAGYPAARAWSTAGVTRQGDAVLRRCLKVSGHGRGGREGNSQFHVQEEVARLLGLRRESSRQRDDTSAVNKGGVMAWIKDHLSPEKSSS
jgi:hypothetical protein